MDKIILWLDGRKTYISAVTLVVVPYLVSSGVITAQLGALITAIVGILTGTGKYVTDYAVNNDSELGKSIKYQRLNK